MAKKFNKLMKRISALEKIVADFLAGKTTSAGKTKKKTAKAAKASRSKSAKKPAKAMAKPAAKPPRKVKKSAPASRPVPQKNPAAKPVKKPARKKPVRVRPPTVQQLMPVEMPEFVQPLDKV